MIKFKNSSIIILIFLTTHLTFTYSQLTDYECVADDSKNYLKTFTQLLVETKSFNSYEKYTLYQESKNLVVSIKYSKSVNSSLKSLCAVYFRVDDSFPRYVFIDFCYGKSNTSTQFKYFDNDLIKKDVLTRGDFPFLDCNKTIVNEYNETHWEEIVKYKKYFQCAKLTKGKLAIRVTFNSSIVQLTTKFGDDGLSLKKISLRSSKYRNTNIDFNSGVCALSKSWCMNTNLTSNTTIRREFPNNKIVRLYNPFDETIHSLSNKASVNSTSSVSQNITLQVCDVITLQQWMTILSFNWTLDLSKHTTEQECNFFNYDKTIKTFGGEMIKSPFFVNKKRNVVLYDYKRKLMVTTKYRICKTTDYNSPLYCMCGLYVRINAKQSHFAYIDYCNIQDTQTLKFKYYNSKTRNNRSEYEDLNCDKEFKTEKDEDWSKVPVSQYFFKCAKLKTAYSDTFLITTVGLDYNIRLKVELKSDDIIDPLTELSINPALVSEEATEGLCGKWSKSKEIECNFFDNDKCITLEDTEKILEHWSMNHYHDDEYILNFDDDMYIPDPDTDMWLPPVNGDEEELPPPIPPPQRNLVSRERYCSSHNDPHMRSIGGRNFEFQKEGNYILYAMGKVLFISATFVSCGKSAKCNCAVFISSSFDEVIQDSAYIDLCNAKDSYNNFEFGPNIYSKEKCANSEALSYDQIFNDLYWEEKRELSEISFKKTPDLKIDCAVIPMSRNAGTIANGNYFFRITHTTNSMYNVIVEVQVQGNWINFIKVHPSKYSNSYRKTSTGAQGVTISQFVTHTGGLCGRWFNNTASTNCDLYAGDPTNDYSCIPYGQELVPLANYWESDKYQPADDFRLKSHKKLDSKYSAQLNTLKKLETFTELVEIPLVRSINNTEAEQICRSRLSYKKKTINKDLNSFLEDTIRMCVKDIEMTGSVEEWVEMHNNVLKEELLKTILNDPVNFDANGILLDKTLDDYGISCINDCSGHGKCNKNPFCKLGAHCNNIVSCKCDENFGNVDCSVDLRKNPIFSLVESCCDSRTMNCPIFHGVGPHFSTNDKILYKIQLLTDSSAPSDDSVFYTGIARVTDSKLIEMDYPFGFLSKIRLNHVIARIGISYGKSSDYFWQNVTFFDSLCRTCINGSVNSNTILPGTCISESGKCKKINNDGTCKDTVACTGAMDLGVLVQTSGRATETEYEMEKNAIADIVGNLNLGNNKVQAGFIYYSKRSRTILSLLKKDQVNKKRPYYVDRIKSLPYMPFLTTPLVKTFQLSSERMFYKREDGTLVPRVALLFNDNKGDDSLDSIRAEANRIKNEGIEVFTIGIGNTIDNEQLNILASDSSHVLKVRDHGSIYESIDDILTRICTVQAKVVLDQEVTLNNLGLNDTRYFKVELNNLISSTFLIETIEPIGILNLYWSFVEPNPTLENSDSFHRKKKNTKSNGNLYLFYAPSMDVKTLYLTIFGVENVNDIKFTVSNIDFI